MRPHFLLVAIAAWLLKVAATPTSHPASNGTTAHDYHQLSNIPSPDSLTTNAEITPFLPHELDFLTHNVSRLQYLAATHSPSNDLISLTSAEAAAIIAADESPTHTPWTLADTKPENYQAPAEKEHIAHIYRALNASLKMEEIHALFHDEEGRPLRRTDSDMDVALGAYPECEDLVGCKKGKEECDVLWWYCSITFGFPPNPFMKREEDDSPGQINRGNDALEDSSRSTPECEDLGGCKKVKKHECDVWCVLCKASDDEWSWCPWPF